MAERASVEQRISIEQRTCGGGRGETKIIIVWPPLAIAEVVGNDELVEGSSRKLLPALASAAHKRTACHDMIMVQAG